MTERARILIAGGGIIGTSVAWALAERGHPAGTGVFLGALCLRVGALPFSFWTTGLFERASLAGALLHALPFVGVVGALRLALPVLEEETLRSVGVACLGGAVLAAALGPAALEVGFERRR